jgi:hypothetical protein
VDVGWRADIGALDSSHLESQVNLHPPRACALTESSYLLLYSVRLGTQETLALPIKATPTGIMQAFKSLEKNMLTVLFSFSTYEPILRRSMASTADTAQRSGISIWSRTTSDLLAPSGLAIKERAIPGTLSL